MVAFDFFEKLKDQDVKMRCAVAVELWARNKLLRVDICLLAFHGVRSAK